MSFEKKMEENWEVISRKMMTLQEALTWSESGNKVIDESTKFTQSKHMLELMESFGNDEINEKERTKISQYFAQALEGNPKKNIKSFEQYLENLTKDDRKKNNLNWYNSILALIKKMQESEEFNIYADAYTKFQNDPSENAKLSRQVIEKVNQSLKNIVIDESM